MNSETTYSNTKVKQRTLQKEINKLKMKTKNIKDELTKDMENLRKKNQTETKITVESHSSRLQQVEDRISELKDKTETKEKKQKKS
jgi:hypothetical protein